jgi:hypothetical protein
MSRMRRQPRRCIRGSAAARSGPGRGGERPGGDQHGRQAERPREAEHLEGPGWGPAPPRPRRRGARRRSAPAPSTGRRRGPPAPRRRPPPTAPWAGSSGRVCAGRGPDGSWRRLGRGGGAAPAGVAVARGRRRIDAEWGTGDPPPESVAPCRPPQRGAGPWAGPRGTGCAGSGPRPAVGRLVRRGRRCQPMATIAPPTPDTLAPPKPESSPRIAAPPAPRPPEIRPAPAPDPRPEERPRDPPPPGPPRRVGARGVGGGPGRRLGTEGGTPTP